MHYDVMVCGAGFTGAVIAERIASQLGKRVLLVDRRDHVGGNAYDHYDNSGVLVHRYGPHIFHTNSARIVSYLSQFTDWIPYAHRVRGWVDGCFSPLPVNMTTLEIFFGESRGQAIIKLLTDEFGVDVKVPILKMRESASAEVRRIADVIYEKVFLHYTMKQWGLLPEQLDPSVSARVPVHLSRDDRYFQDQFQSMPRAGFTALFTRMLNHPNIETRTNTSLDAARTAETCDLLVFTGPIDEFFDRSCGALPYRSIRFDFVTHNSGDLVQGVGTENYPTPVSEHAYTRSTEFRFLTGQHDVPATTRVFEYPEHHVPGLNEPYYPIPREENRERFREYERCAATLKSVVFAGRLADYQYYNMDQAVARALTCFEKEIVPLIAR